MSVENNRAGDDISSSAKGVARKIKTENESSHAISDEQKQSGNVSDIAQCWLRCSGGTFNTGVKFHSH